MRTDVFIKDSVGHLMTQAFITLHESFTVDQAITHVRKYVRDKENIHYLYITMHDNTLTGVLSLRELLAAHGGAELRDIMKTELYTLPAHLDQEIAAEHFQDTDLVSMPVINQKEQLLGVVHVEDMLDVIEEEVTEDFQKMAPVSALEEGIKDASVFTLYRKRIGWLVILVFMNVFSGAGIAHFEDVIESNIALVFFLPLLVDSGGNAGSQSATLMIRAMATGDVTVRDWVKMFTKEISVAIALGGTMALAVATVGLFRGGPEIALVVALTMVLIVIVGSLIGMSLPFIFKKFNLDPATASAPLITSIADIVGVLIYFSIAAWLLTL
ncbi:MAG TPA: magnesium transporter [Cerasibacillus sp.]|uniref:magnesium transporter n=1 Tax=Cerasibacillus sp. TaxID=2498711 RepID=UPI002F40343F